MKRWLVLIITLAILGSLIVWRIGQKTAAAQEQKDMRATRSKMAPPVVLATVGLQDISRTFEAAGTVEAPLDVKIAPKVTGRIDYLQMREGDRVKKGQVLVRINPDDVEAQVQQQQAALAEAQYRLAQAQLTQNPADVSINTQIELQKASLASASADNNQVKQNYEALVAASNASVADAQAKIDSASAAIKSAEANLTNAQAKLKRAEELFKKGFVSAQTVDDAKAAASVQQSAVEVTQGLLRSAQAVKRSAEQQASIVRTKGRADIEASDAKLQQAKVSLTYAKANTAQKAAYAQSISALKAGVAAARASLRSAQAKRADTVLVSPLDGYVTARYVDPGAIATGGQPIIAVMFMKQVWVSVSVPEELSAKIHLNQPAQVRIDAFPDRVFAGNVIQVNPAADPQNRQFTVRVILSNTEGVFKPGMFARVSLETDHVAKAIAVPREAVQKDQSGSFVMVVDTKGKASKRPIVTGTEDADHVAIESGVDPGEKVVVMSAFPLRDGQPVRTGGGRGKRATR